MADWTGLEPATPGVTGRYSNQLNYQSASCFCKQQSLFNHFEVVVGDDGIEPPTLCL